MPRQRGRRAALAISAAASMVVVATVLLDAAPAAAQAHAHERALQLEWTAPASCPARDDVLARVDELLESSPAPDRTVSARGHVTEAAGRPRYRLDLVVMGNEANRRSLSGDDCAHLADAAALILALALDPEALTRGEPAPAPTDAGLAPPIEAAPPKPPPPRIDAPVAATPTAHPRSPLGLSASARMVLDVGSLPRATSGIGAVLTLTGAHLAFELAATTYERRFTLNGPRNGRAGAWVDLATASAHGCYRDTVLHIDLRACLGGELGRESTSGVNLVRSRDVSGLWSAASAMLLARALPRSRISPVAGLSLVVPIGSPPVVVDNFGTLFDPSPVVLRFMLGLDVALF